MYEIEKENCKKTIKEKGLKGKVFKNYRIYIEPEKVYNEFFCHGIEGREELLEGIIFFSHNDELGRIQNTNFNNLIKDKSELDRTIDRATEIFLQFYRFVDLNDRDRVPNYYYLESERNLESRIKEQIKSKIKQLSDSNDDYMFISNQERRENPVRYDKNERNRDIRIRRIKEEQDIASKANREIRTEQSFKKRELGEHEKRQIYDRVKEQYLNTKKIKIDNDKVLYSERERGRYAHFPEQSNPDNIQEYIIRHWTEDVYDILSYLSDLEKSDKMEYYKIWLHTRIERLKNIGHIDDDVRKEIDLLTKQKENVQKLQMKREERTRAIYRLRQQDQER